MPGAEALPNGYNAVVWNWGASFLRIDQNNTFPLCRISKTHVF